MSCAKYKRNKEVVGKNRPVCGSPLRHLRMPSPQEQKYDQRGYDYHLQLRQPEDEGSLPEGSPDSHGPVLLPLLQLPLNHSRHLT